MSLWGALNEHEGALRAAFQHEYQLRLLRGGNGRTEPSRTVLEVADYVVNLPPGSALHRAVGNSAAMTGPEALLRELIYAVQVLDWHAHNPKGRAPDHLPYPDPVAPPRPSKRSKSLKNKANAWAERQARRAAGS